MRNQLGLTVSRPSSDPADAQVAVGRGKEHGWGDERARAGRPGAVGVGLRRQQGTDLRVAVAIGGAVDDSPRRRCQHQDRHRHGPLPHPWPSGLLGPLRARRQAVSGQDQRQERHRARQPLPCPGAGRGGRGRRQDRHTFLGDRFRRIARRRGAKRAIVAVGRSILVIVWHLLADPTARSPSIFRISVPARSGGPRPSRGGAGPRCRAPGR
jgi:hypothetical protein